MSSALGSAPERSCTATAPASAALQARTSRTCRSRHPALRRAAAIAQPRAGPHSPEDSRDGEDEGDGGSHGSPEALDDTDEVLSSDAGGALFSESGYSSAGGPFGYASAGAYNAATDTDGDVGD